MQSLTPQHAHVDRNALFSFGGQRLPSDSTNGFSKPFPFGTSLKWPNDISAAQTASGSSPPDAIILSGPDFYKSHIRNLYGGYKRTRNLYGKTTYQKDPHQGSPTNTEAFIYWSAADTTWCVSTQLGATIMGAGEVAARLGSDEIVPVPIYQLHQHDWDYPRLSGTWVANLFGNGARYQAEHMLTFEALELPLEASDPERAIGSCMHILTAKFVDYCFPPMVGSVEGVPPPIDASRRAEANAPITWAPASAFGLEKEGALFRAATEPRGDWLASLDSSRGGIHPLFASVREYPGHLESLFSCTPNINALGEYHVWLFNIWTGKWQRVVVDDFIPMVLDSPGGGLVPWAGGHGRTLWASLLEKALAKLCGSYNALADSDIAPILMAIAGQHSDALDQWVRDGGWWSRWRFLPPEARKVMPQGGHQRVREARALKCCTARVPGTWHQSPELFATLREAHRQNALLLAYRDSGKELGGMRKPAHVDPSGNGLVCGHGYSILQLVEVDGASDGSEPTLLVQLRNVWGPDVTWRGAWAEGSLEWEKFPEIRRHHLRPEYQGSGRFWMLWSDFSAYFDRVEVCPMPEAARKASYAPTRLRTAPLSQRRLRGDEAENTGLATLLGWRCCSVEMADKG